MDGLDTAQKINSYAKYKEYLLYHIKNKDVIMVQGSPGIGKSEIIEALIEALKIKNPAIKFVMFNERLYQRGDFAPGAAYINDKENITSWTVPIWLKHITDCQDNGQMVILILDDAHLIKPYVQDMLYQYLERYQLNEAQAKRHPIVMIGNWGIESAKCYNVQSPVMGRIAAFYKLKPNVKEWIYRFDKELNKKIKLFVLKYPSLFYTEFPEEMEKFSSPRDWLRLNKAIDTHPLGFKCAVAYIGKTAGGKFIKEYDLLVEDIDEILKENYSTMSQQVLASEQLGVMVEESRVNEIFNYIHKKFNTAGEALTIYYKIIHGRRLLKALQGNEKASKLAKQINDAMMV